MTYMCILIGKHTVYSLLRTCNTAYTYASYARRVSSMCIPVQPHTIHAIQRQSGTSCDGVDCALIRTDGYLLSELREFETIEYDSDLRSKLAG